MPVPVRRPIFELVPEGHLPIKWLFYVDPNAILAVFASYGPGSFSFGKGKLTRVSGIGSVATGRDLGIKIGFCRTVQGFISGNLMRSSLQVLIVGQCHFPALLQR